MASSPRTNSRYNSLKTLLDLSFQYIAKEFGDFDDELAEKVFRELDVSANGHLSADQVSCSTSVAQQW